MEQLKKRSNSNNKLNTKKYKVDCNNLNDELEIIDNIIQR